jgi:hypothetical protein
MHIVIDLYVKLARTGAQGMIIRSCGIVELWSTKHVVPHQRTGSKTEANMDARVSLKHQLLKLKNDS